MSLKASTVASVLLVCCTMAVSVEAQLVRKLGNLPMFGKARQTSFTTGGCDSCAEPSCGIAGCDDASCGCQGPSCGLAGSLLGGIFSAGPGGCGAAIEPRCGSDGLSYAGGFGLCGGSCDGCGDGGFMGRNLRKVNPCACGGSLVGDMARGLIDLVDRAIGATVTSFFGGLQKATCHATGTLAALECAATAGCDSCGMAGCDGCGMAPSCGLADPSCGCDAVAACDGPACGAPATLASPHGYPTTSAPTMASPVHAPIPPAPATNYSQPMTPTPAAPMPAAEPAPATDPFLDDVAPSPQARVRIVPQSRRLGTPTLAAPRTARMQQSRVGQAAYTTAASQRYFSGGSRPLNLRR